MLDKILQDLNADDFGTRQAGWNRLCSHAMEIHLALSEKQKRYLVERLSNERVPDVRKSAIHCLFAIALRQPFGGTTVDSATPDVANWFWEPLHRRSAIFRGIDATRRRDEDAVIELARAFPRRDYPSTVFMRIPLSRPDWESRMDFEPKAVCLVGRLGIYGAQAVSAFESSSTRFYFPNQERPDNLEPGDLDPQFHRIQQRNARNQALPAFITRQDEATRRRTDYALVQRYYDDVRGRFVIILAGSSGLGTLGAVDWSTHLEGLKFPMPEVGLKEKDMFEALIEVDAEPTEFPWHWHTRATRAIRVLAGNNLEWYPEEGEWGTRRPDLLRIRRAAGGLAEEVFSESDRDGRVFRDRSPPVRFVEAVYELTGGIPPATIQPDEWKGHLGVFQEILGNRTYRGRLREGLHDALSIDNASGQVTLTVPIQVMT